MAVFPLVAFLEQHLKPEEGKSILEPTSGPVKDGGNITKVLRDRGYPVIENDIATGGNHITHLSLYHSVTLTLTNRRRFPYNGD